MTSQLLSCWHLKSYRERLGMNDMTFVFLRLREASITNEQWYFAMVIITRGWIHVRDDRFSQFRNRKNLRSLESFGKWNHNLLARATCPAKTSLIPSALPNVLLVMACPWLGLFSIVEIFLKNDAMEPEEITNIEIYRLKLFFFKRHIFVLHVTSVNTGSVQVMHRAVGARTMHGFGTDLVRNPAIWLVESRDQVN